MDDVKETISITATSDHPKRDVAHLQRRGLVALLGRRARNFEGVYLKVTDGAGRTVFDVGHAPRNGTGLSWVSPELGLSRRPFPSLPGN